MEDNRKPAPFSDIHSSHKMMGDVCKHCNLNAKQDWDLMTEECVRKDEPAPKGVGDRFQQIQDAVNVAMQKVGDQVHKKFAELMKVGPGMDPQVQAKMLVLKSFNENRDKADSQPLHFEDVYVVKFSYVLGNWKALISTTVSDGKYYEVTHRAEPATTYVDTYVKLRNEETTDEELFAQYDVKDEDPEQPTLAGLSPEEWKG